jgi:hypothetical protein
MAPGQALRRAYPHDLVKGAVIRLEADYRYKRPFGLEIAWRDRESKVTGAIRLGGFVTAQDGTTARERRPVRTIVVMPDGPQPELIRRAPPPEFTAKLMSFQRLVPPVDVGPGPPPVEVTSPVQLTTRWCIVSDETGQPLPGKGTGPAVAGEYVQCGEWDAARPTPWFARECSDQAAEEPRRDPIEQCIARVRQERGILHVERIAYDLSAWPHDSAMVLTVDGWRCTYECRHCGQKLKLIPATGRFTGLDDDNECHAATWNED